MGRARRPTLGNVHLGTKKQWEKWISSGSIPHATQVWCPHPGASDGPYYWFHWTGCDDHLRLLDLGMICRTKAEAIAKARKMLEAIR